uniref:Uncharacterized protein n=1 Tax=Chromera velia CCMP2878 TaxID=1169474 RepID=A0A0G4I389_9ALVE|eukprot:Cvel_10580.t1-p1 / transcript=Cvel_10580.t1 / gene=Cvel_10580 / organism=Chromera_velia_CCMP2878 / gene_product=hypothetical protein / transcript_product=hypothetical protein / location=Cvel_scaffold641:29158-30213(+) / protein_length=352 / sequence_SO=supercontig / SO=protein_coding / is_pseudo=false
MARTFSSIPRSRLGLLAVLLPPSLLELSFTQTTLRFVGPPVKVTCPLKGRLFGCLARLLAANGLPHLVSLRAPITSLPDSWKPRPVDGAHNNWGWGEEKGDSYWSKQTPSSPRPSPSPSCDAQTRTVTSERVHLSMVSPMPPISQSEDDSEEIVWGKKHDQEAEVSSSRHCQAEENRGRQVLQWSGVSQGSCGWPSRSSERTGGWEGVQTGGWGNAVEQHDRASCSLKDCSGEVDEVHWGGPQSAVTFFSSLPSSLQVLCLDESRLAFSAWKALSDLMGSGGLQNLRTLSVKDTERRVVWSGRSRGPGCRSPAACIFANSQSVQKLQNQPCWSQGSGCEGGFVSEGSAVLED